MLGKQALETAYCQPFHPISQQKLEKTALEAQKISRKINWDQFIL